VRSRSSTILTVLALTNLISYAARNALFAVYPDLKVQFGIDDDQIGLLTTVYMIPHAAATLPFGWIGDRSDRRRVIAIGMVLAGIAGAAGAFAQSFASLAVSRAAVGFGTAAVVPVANSILGQIFDGPVKASRIAVFNLGLFFGGVAGFAAGFVFGFPAVAIVIAVPGIALAAALRALTIPEPRGQIAEARTFGSLARQFLSDGRALLRIRTLRWVMLSTTAMAFTAGGYSAWLKEFLTRSKRMSDAEAGELLATTLIGGIAGIIVGARIADRLARRYESGRLWTIALGMTCTIPCAIACIELPVSPALYVAGVANLFFFSWYHAPMAASVDDLAPPALAVSAQALVIFTMHLIGTAPSSYVVGLVSSESNLYRAMWVPTGALVVAALAMLVATRSFPADRQRAGGGTPRSL
jgi:predicted MFS family arabinose efflux permease